MAEEFDESITMKGVKIDLENQECANCGKPTGEKPVLFLVMIPHLNDAPKPVVQCIHCAHDKVMPLLDPHKWKKSLEGWQKKKKAREN